MKGSTQTARWGLLITTLLLGVALVGTGWMGYLGARDARAEVIQARATDLVFSVRRQLVLAGSPGQEQIAELLADLEDQGLRFVGLTDRDGQWAASAGALADPSLPPPRTCCAGQPFRMGEAGGSIRVIAPLAPGRGEGQGRGFWRRHRPGGELDPRLHLLVLEFEPVGAQVLTTRALWTLLVGLAAAGVLLAAALVFWRLAVREQRLIVQLAQDRQLRALGTMSSVLGHELRNPLTALKGHAQLLLERLPPDLPARKSAQTVVQEAIRLEELTTQVLDFARTGALSLGHEKVADLARAAAEEVDAAGGRVRIEAASGIPDWPLDAQHMRQALVNLLRNALQASPAKAVVTLSLQLQSGKLVLEVRDHGEGLVPGEEERVFEPFYTRQTKGTGLGLALVRRIVEGHGGRVTAANHPAGGAIFRIELPAGGEV